MSFIVDAWEKERLCYQKRYAAYAKRYEEMPEDKDAAGHLHECSYVLISVFGLTSKQVDELERHNYCGLTQDDLDSEM